MPPGRPRIIAFALLAFLALGVASAWWTADHGLTLAHYDARGHLIVARRVIDSLTPGWRQFGAVWLPLPHLINAIPVQVDAWFRTGASAVAINVLVMALGLTSLARLVARATGSWTAGASGAALVALNPDVLYLTGTPMTEPLLMALAWLTLDAALRPGGPGAWTGPLLALAALTRYEAWPIAAALVTLTAMSRPRVSRMVTFLRLAAWPAGAAVAFLVLGRLAVGTWFTGGGFYTPDNPARHSVAAVAGELWDGYLTMGGPVLALGTAAGVGVAAWRAWQARAWAPLVPVSLFAAAAIPALAFYDGHPFRIRYIVPLIAASGAFAGMALGALPGERPRTRVLAGLVLVALSVAVRPPFSTLSPMVRESGRESITQAGRAAITRALAAEYDGRPILASMDSLGHYMQETSAIGLPLRAYLHEGNGDLWAAAFAHPERHVGWVLIEEAAEGGDALAWRARRNPAWLAGFSEVTRGGGAVLYRRR